ncbi:hypothetical protein RF11_16373 [Thelohanellus kitauei]|uniref:Uncharacterized protein n=1 Tax=Thelohanellus kitauei TaxID=669202 RepID=A0A0C2M175_THEKT|nr:hypothetical protein RF11_03621 [Thelohanellus kitauei]KII63564.1 hypothetical protein RF11_16373 [Thelohanellus kitauei]
MPFEAQPTAHADCLKFNREGESNTNRRGALDSFKYPSWCKILGDDFKDIRSFLVFDASTVTRERTTGARALFLYFTGYLVLATEVWPTAVLHMAEVATFEFPLSQPAASNVRDAQESTNSSAVKDD